MEEKYFIKTDRGYFQDQILKSFVPDRENAHAFDDINEALEIMKELSLDGISNIELFKDYDDRAYLNCDDHDLIQLYQVAREYVIKAEKDAEINPKTNEIQIVIVEPMRIPYKKWIPNTLEAMQGIVHGYIEQVTFGETKSGAKIGIILNEEGKLQGLPLNRRIMKYDILVGNFFLTAFNMQGDNVSLSDEECERLIKKFTPIDIYI